jgi:hypothetical protein
MKIILIVLLVIALLIVCPLAVIWALNTLFLLSIPFSLKTWAAVVVLCMIFNNKSRSKE